MEPMKVGEIVDILGAESGIRGIPYEAEIRGISTDTRTIATGDLFIPLKGENFDGHGFIDNALAKGALLALSSETERSGAPGAPVLIVNDTLAAYHCIARAYRKKFSLPIVAVTGSNGKTTTKDLMAAILSKKYRTMKTQENFNNEIGVPRTLLEIDRDLQMLVVEMAMRGKGQIRQLAGIALPDVGVITNVGEAHYELLGSYEAIADAKGELLECLTPAGTALLNADDRWFSHLAGKCRCTVRSFGQAEGSSMRLLSYRSLGIEGFIIEVDVAARGIHSFTIPFMGFHNIYNSLAALSVGFLFDVDPAAMQEALHKVRRTGKRMEKILTDDGLIIINDTYNASPSSVEQALKTLALLPLVGKRIAVLGDMRELGEIAEVSHRAIGEKVRKSSVDYLITLGDMGKWIAEAARKSGMPDERCLWYEDRAQAVARLNEIAQPGDVVLVKASRLMKLEEVVDALSALRSRKVASRG
jgi:UDP-N-acetylmuramoyl-tripeptide--D-alanyl-D-alanine ligase